MKPNKNHKAKKNGCKYTGHLLNSVKLTKKFKTTKEGGRSMIELLCVLALIDVLSIGGIWKLCS